MPVEIVTSTTCEAPCDAAFAYVADYRNVPHWLFGIHEFTPVGDRDYGLGSVFDASVHLGLRLHSRIEVDEFVEDRLIAFDSVKGFKVRSRWNFEPVAPGRTTITAQVTYALPFGPAGRAMGKVVEPAVKQAVAHSSDELTARIEAAARS
jgi:uncharacterized membrane protein